MMQGNKKKNILEEMERAGKAMEAANLLFKNGLLNDAISRLYYFVLYNIGALLLTKGFEPRSHEGTLGLFGLYFVKKGIFDPESSHIFSKLMKYWEEADYNPTYVFTKEDYVEFKKEAGELANKINTYLEEKGYL